jgi:endonuclease III
LLESEKIMKKETLKILLENFGKKYSQILGTNLKDGNDEEIFKWFLASILFGAPITETSVIKTYQCFQKHGVLTPKRILEAEWEDLVKILDEGCYTRYDFKTADKLLAVMRNLTENYNGSLNLLHSKASNARELENMLKDLGKGIGDVTVSIFLRELRDIWEKAKPNPTSLVISAAKNLGIVKEEATENTLKQLEDFWAKDKVAGESFINFETALLRLGKDFCRKGRCASCPVKSDCLNPKVS